MKPINRRGVHAPTRNLSQPSLPHPFATNEPSLVQPHPQTSHTHTQEPIGDRTIVSTTYLQSNQIVEHVTDLILCLLRNQSFTKCVVIDRAAKYASQLPGPSTWQADIIRQ